MAATNGETYQLIDGVVVKGFMDPTDVFDSTGKKTADGYTIKVLDKDNTPIPMSKGWVVDPVNGAVTFEKGKTPTDQSFGAIKIVAFAYVGECADDNLTSLETKVKSLETVLGTGDNSDGDDQTLTTKVADLRIDVDTISGKVGQNTSDIATNKSNIEANDKDIEYLSSAITGLVKVDDSRYDEFKLISGQVVKNTSDIATNKTDIATNKANIEANDKDIEYLSSAITGLVKYDDEFKSAYDDTISTLQ
jgi:hypothetical protein